MPSMSSQELYELVVDQLPADHEVLSEAGEVRPLHLFLPDGEEAMLYVWTLTQAGAGTNRPADEHRIQLKLPGQTSSERAGVDHGRNRWSVVLGYSEEMDVFALWETRHYRDFAYNRNVQIPGATLAQARDDGWAVAPLRRLATGIEVRVAAPRDRLLDLIDAALDADQADLMGDERRHFMALRGDPTGEFQTAEPGASESGNIAIPVLRSGPRSAGRTSSAPVSTRSPGGMRLQIRPRVGMYAAFARLNYKPWFAIAELVDNALQSFIANRGRLQQVDGHDGSHPLEVEVRIESGLIRVTDKAAGIARSDMSRAFSPAQPPDDNRGLSEFGIGMKAASCWFANRWSVRTSALDDAAERTVRFDVPRIVDEGIESLDVETASAAKDDHYTVLELTDLRVQPKTRTIGKIKDHLASIYREFIRRGDLQLRFVTTSSDEVLTVEDPDLLEAPYFRELDGAPRRWRKSLDVDLGEGRRVHGWAGLLSKASTGRAGFAVLRRGRLIQGSADETWRPEQIFKKPNKYTYQRLVGELSVEGFNVSHTKDGIQWDGHEDELYEKLLDRLDAEPLPLIKQAEGHRVRKTASRLAVGFGQDAVDTSGSALEQSAEPIVQEQVGETPGPDPAEPLPTPERVLAGRTFHLRPRGDNNVWAITIQVIRDRAQDWYSCDAPHASPEGSDHWSMTIQLNLDHPFSEQFINEDEAVLVPLVRIVAGLGLAEHTAREAGVRSAGQVRRNFNKLLRGSLCDARAERDSDD